jgi:hypothetical protein
VISSYCKILNNWTRRRENLNWSVVLFFDPARSNLETHGDGVVVCVNRAHSAIQDSLLYILLGCSDIVLSELTLVLL